MLATQPDTAQLVFLDIYLPMLNNNERFNVLYGGAGSGKSNFAVDKMILKALKYPGRTVLFVRKRQSDNRDSIFQLTLDELDKLNILERCRVSVQSLTIRLPNGSRFIYKGLDEADKLKSIAGVDDIVIEEADQVSQDDFSQLNLRLRSMAENQQIHILFNPVSKSSWLYRYFFENGTPPNTRIIKSTYLDNPFLPKDYIDEMQRSKETNPYYYQVYALGNWGVLGKKVYTRWEETPVNVNAIRTRRGVQAIFGLDFGFMTDPSTLFCALVDPAKKELYVFDEMYEKGLTNDLLAERIIEMGYGKEVIVADSAERKSIEELRRHGLSRIRPAKKGPGSVNQGIQYLQQYDWYVDPSCSFTLDELDQYVYKKDRATGLYLNQPVDNHNHIMDAARYATEPMQRPPKQHITKTNLGF